MCTCDEQDLCCILEESKHDDEHNFSFGKQNICSTAVVETLATPKNYETSFVKVTPSTLTFPYNNPAEHIQRLTLWNQTLTAVKIRIESPDSEVFTVCIDGDFNRARARCGMVNHFILYGLAAKTISVKCNPGRYKMLHVPLQVLVYRLRDNACECFQIPLEIYPSTLWFNLPTTIVIPEVVIGRKAHALIILPQPRVSERFFVTFQPTQTQNAITLSPMNGTIGGNDGIKQLKITYAPTAYTTVSCSIKVHFPGLSNSAAHEIKILARCRPGHEADLIRKEMAEIESFRPKPVRQKKKYIKLRFKTAQESNVADKGHKDNAQEHRKPLSLFTIAGVVRFLLSKGDAENEYINDEEITPEGKTAVELLALEIDLSDEEKIQIYNAIKKRLGFDFEEDTGSFRSRLKTYQRKDWEEFQNSLGMLLMGKIEELPQDEGESETEHERFRKSRFSMTHQKNRKSMLSNSEKKHVKKSVSEEERKMYKSIMADVQLDLTPKQKFVQMILKVITQQRAEKRLAKIKKLVEEIKRTTRRKSSMGRSLKSLKSTTRKSINGSTSEKKSANSLNKPNSKNMEFVANDRTRSRSNASRLSNPEEVP